MKRYPKFIPNDWRDCYKLPLHLDSYYLYAFDKDNTTALSFLDVYDDNEHEERVVTKIVSIINGEIESDFDPDWTIDKDDPVQINYKGEHQFLVRGWGYLTGSGNAMNLPEEIAIKIQDAFIEYILRRLNCINKIK